MPSWIVSVGLFYYVFVLGFYLGFYVGRAVYRKSQETHHA